MNNYNIEGIYNKVENQQKYLPDALLIQINNTIVIGSISNDETDEIKEFLIPIKSIERSSLLKTEYEICLLDRSYIPKFIVNLYLFETYILVYIYDNEYKLKEKDLHLENEVNELFIYFGINNSVSSVINRFYNPKRTTIYIYTLFYNILSNKIKLIQGPAPLIKFITNNSNILFNWNNLNIDYSDNSPLIGSTGSSFDKTILYTEINDNLYIRNILFSILKNSNNITFSIEKYEKPLIINQDTYLYEDWYIQGNLNKLTMF